MDWKQLLGDLRNRGWTQQQIAERVGASQAAISDLNSGKTTNPNYAIGRALEELRSSEDAPPRVETKAA